MVPRHSFKEGLPDDVELEMIHISQGNLFPIFELSQNDSAHFLTHSTLGVYG
jgi:hypothetical protein